MVWKPLMVGSNYVNVKESFHLGFTGLVQLRDRLFQLFMGITINKDSSISGSRAVRLGNLKGTRVYKNSV